MEKGMTIAEIVQQLREFLSGFTAAFVPQYVVPNVTLIIKIAILVVAAYILARIGKGLMVRALGAVGFRRAGSTAWAEGMLKVAGYRGTMVSLLGDLVKWLVYLLFLGLILQTIGLAGVGEFFTQVAIFIPRFIGAVIIFVLGFLVAEFFGAVFGEAGRKLSGEELIGTVAGGLAKYLIALVAMIMALALIGIDTASLSVLFAILFGGAVLLVVLGLRDLFPNYTAMLALRTQLKVGMRIRAGGTEGMVERLTPTAVWVRGKGKRTVLPGKLLVTAPYEEVKGESTPQK